MLNPKIEDWDWANRHMDFLVERAVKAEMQRDELLRVIKPLLAVADSAAPATGMRSYGEGEREAARTAIAKIEEAK